MTTHLDLDALADVLAGEGDRSHLDDCPECQSRLAELEAAMPSVAGSLTTLVMPDEPPDLAGRLMGTLAEERRPTVADIVPLASHRRIRWIPALAAAAAAALIVTGALVYTQGGGKKSPTTEAAQPAPIALSSTGTDYTKAGPELRTALPALLKGHAPSGQTLRAAVPQTAVAGAVPKSSGDPLATLRTTSGLASCLAAVTDPSSTDLPLALDYAEFDHQPALLIVLRDPKPDHVAVFFVGAACSQADAKVLFFTRLPKP